MKLITLKYDPTSTTPAIHEAAMTVLAGLGYEFTGMSEVPTDEEPLVVPTMYGFHVSEGATIDSLKKDIPLSNYCKDFLTDENFATPVAKRPIVGGFYPVEEGGQPRKMLANVNELSKQTGRKFRVGTPIELLQFWLENRIHCPKYFASVGQIWNGEILYCGDEGKVFCLGDYCGKDCNIFVVEELD